MLSMHLLCLLPCTSILPFRLAFPIFHASSSFVVPEGHSTAHDIPSTCLSRWEPQLRVHDPRRPMLVVPPTLSCLLSSTATPSTQGGDLPQTLGGSRTTATMDQMEEKYIAVTFRMDIEILFHNYKDMALTAELCARSQKSGIKFNCDWTKMPIPLPRACSDGRYLNLGHPELSVDTLKEWLQESIDLNDKLSLHQEDLSFRRTNWHTSLQKYGGQQW
ncbi:hypothetical protein B0H10DRAFT_1957998 [Mycena sp. CBHHK59/15]|nr:hypothetical protein B0H10DRAFT_1957998 [Mycena sp. CBHHK59/15]